jgi:hypothetical protein
MARPRILKQTPFGEWLSASGRSTSWAAEKLGLTGPYVDKLRRGASVPSLALALEIERLTTTKGVSAVPASSWVLPK